MGKSVDNPERFRRVLCMGLVTRVQAHGRPRIVIDPVLLDSGSTTAQLAKALGLTDRTIQRKRKERKTATNT